MSWPAAIRAVADRPWGCRSRRSCVMTRRAVRRQSMAGDAVGGIAGEILGQFRRRGGLEPQIHLHPHGRGERLDHVDRLQAPQLGLGALDQLRQPAHEVDVAGKGALDARAQHLDRDQSALDAVIVACRGVVNLRDRRGRHRIVVEFGEQLADRTAQLGLDREPRLPPRETAPGDPAGATGRPPPHRPAGPPGSTASGPA